MSNSLGAVDDPAELYPASSANPRFPEEKLSHPSAASSAAGDIGVSGGLSHCTPSKPGSFQRLDFFPLWKWADPVICAAALLNHEEPRPAVAGRLHQLQIWILAAAQGGRSPAGPPSPIDLSACWQVGMTPAAMPFARHPLGLLACSGGCAI